MGAMRCNTTYQTRREELDQLVEDASTAAAGLHELPQGLTHLTKPEVLTHLAKLTGGGSGGAQGGQGQGQGQQGGAGSTSDAAPNTGVGAGGIANTAVAKEKRKEVLEKWYVLCA
jgi:hypothetical protein